MWMIRAPNYSYRTHSFISKNMSKADGCRICQILEKEPPLADTGQCRIIRTKFRSSPEHVMIVPKEHFQGLQDIKSLDIAKELISDVKRILDRRKHLIAFGLYGLAAGQTMPHLHIHVMSPDPIL